MNKQIQNILTEWVKSLILYTNDTVSEWDAAYCRIETAQPNDFESKTCYTKGNLFDLQNMDASKEKWESALTAGERFVDAVDAETGKRPLVTLLIAKPNGEYELEFDYEHHYAMDISPLGYKYKSCYFYGKGFRVHPEVDRYIEDAAKN